MQSATDELLTDQVQRPPGSKIRRTQIGDGVGYLLPGPGVLAILGPVLSGVVGCVIAGLLTRAVITNGPEAAPVIFVAVIWLGTLGCFALAVSRLKSDGAVAVTGDTLSIITRGLFGSRKRAWSISDDILTVAVMPTTVTDKNNVERVTLELSVLYPEGNSEEFFGDVSDAELTWLAAEIRQLAGLPEPPPNASKDAIVVSSLQQVMQNSVDDMAEHLESAKEALAQFADHLDEPDRRRKFAEIAAMEQEVAAAKNKVLFTDFGLLSFESWDPGRLIQVKRDLLDGRQLAWTSFFSGLGRGFVGLFILPFVIPIVGFFAGLIAHVTPGDRVRLYLTIVDLFAFGWPLLPWLIFFFPLSMAIVAVRLDAAFSRRDVRLDWKSGRLTVTTRHEEQSRLLSEISAVAVHPVTGSNSNRKAPQARLEVDLNGSRIILLETDPAETIAGLDINTPLQRLIPLAEQLGEALKVDVRIEDAVRDDFDVVGYPRQTRCPLTRRMWNNAQTRSKFAVFAVLVAMLVYFTAAGLHAWKANEHVAKQLAAERARAAAD